MKDLFKNIIFIFFIYSCSTYKTRNQVYSSNIQFKGGVLNDQSWDDSLSFKRVSWFFDATENYEILISKLDKDSPFASWLETDRLYLTSCEHFYIVALYADINANDGTSLLTSELNKSGLKEMNILHFSYHMKAHQNFKDWKLGRHKIVGMCSSNKLQDQISISIPGHKTFKLL